MQLFKNVSIRLILINLLSHLFEAVADHIDSDTVVQALASNELACVRD